MQDLITHKHDPRWIGFRNFCRDRGWTVEYYLRNLVEAGFPAPKKLPGARGRLVIDEIAFDHAVSQYQEGAA